MCVRAEGLLQHTPCGGPGVIADLKSMTGQNCAADADGPAACIGCVLAQFALRKLRGEHDAFNVCVAGTVSAGFLGATCERRGTDRGTAGMGWDEMRWERDEVGSRGKGRVC